MLLSDLYGTKEAAIYVSDRARKGRGISRAGFQKHVKSGKLVPIGIGEKDGGAAHTHLFTKRMLDKYCALANPSKLSEPIRPLPKEATAVVTVSYICALSGLSLSTLKYHLDAGNIPGKKVGNVWVALRSDVNEWMEKR